jgi:hypothetical protein
MNLLCTIIQWGIYLVLYACNCNFLMIYFGALWLLEKMKALYVLSFKVASVVKDVPISSKKNNTK